MKKYIVKNKNKYKKLLIENINNQVVVDDIFNFNYWLRLQSQRTIDLYHNVEKDINERFWLSFTDIMKRFFMEFVEADKTLTTVPDMSLQVIRKYCEKIIGNRFGCGFQLSFFYLSNKEYCNNQRFTRLLQIIESNDSYHRDKDVDIVSIPYSSVWNIDTFFLQKAYDKFQERFVEAVELSYIIFNDRRCSSVMRGNNTTSNGLHDNEVLLHIINLISKGALIRHSYDDIIKVFRILNNFTRFKGSPKNLISGNFIKLMNRVKSLELKYKFMADRIMSVDWKSLGWRDDAIAEFVSIRNNIRNKIKWDKLVKRQPKDGWLLVMPDKLTDFILSDKKILSLYSKYKTKIFGDNIKKEYLHSYFAFNNLFINFYNDKDILKSIMDLDIYQIHDAGQFKLPILQDKDFRLLRRIKQDRELVPSIRILSTLVGSYSLLRDEGIDIYTDNMQKIMNFYDSLSYSYENVCNIDVAREAAACGLSQYDFERLQDYILKTPAKQAETLPSIDLALNGYKLSKLVYDSPRHLTIGLHTNCCQHLDEAGRDCAIKSYTDELSAVYVVEKQGKIIAQSWAWVDKVAKGVCFDNIETLGECNDTVAELYRQLAKELIDKMKWIGIKIVTVGLGYDDFHWTGKRPDSNLSYSGYHGYSDASSQVILAEA